MSETWTERRIGGWLARHVFERKCVVVVPNCSWPGSECDILAVTSNLRIIDVEVKVSRADLRADAAKDKWFHQWDWKLDGPYYSGCSQHRRRRDWPRRVWKHYYCLPAEIWRPELVEAVGRASGILLMHADNGAGIRMSVERRATPCRDAERIDAEDAIDIARLASLRMWDAYDALA